MRPSAKTQQQSGTHYVWWVCGFLLVAIALIYGQTLDHELLGYDDSLFVFTNPRVTAGLTGEGIRWAFTDGPAGEWYPLDPLSHMLDCQLFGLHAWGHHLMNVLLHAGSSIALFLVLRRMTDELWPSAFVATLFAVHPQHVESVAWVSERRDMLSGLFFMLTLAAYLGYVRHGRSLGRYFAVAALFALGLMSKPMLVTLPPLLMLLDFWPLARFGSAADTPRWTHSVERPTPFFLVLEKLPLFVLAAGDCLMTLRTHVHANVPVNWSERIGNAAVSCVTYIVQFFYPVDLVAFYPTPAGGPPAWKVAGALAMLAAASAAAVVWRRRCPYFFVGWFWYLGMLTPVLGLVRVSDHTMADRYMYLPGIGLYIALAWGATRLAARRPELRWALYACAALAVGLLVAAANWQTSFWRDDETLWRHALAVTTDNSEAEFGLADALARQGRRDDAVAHYRRAQKHATDSAPFNSLGALFAREGNYDEAIAQFRLALEIEPDSFLTRVNLGMALSRQNRLDEAREQFQRAIEIEPRGPRVHRELARLMFLDGKTDEARAELEQAIEFDPADLVARDNLGATLLKLGNIDEAIAQFEAALAFNPKYLAARINLANAFAERGRTADAIAEYRRALELDPNNPNAREELDKLLRGGAKPTAP